MILNFDEMMQFVDNKPELRAKEEVVDGRVVTIFSYMVSMTDTFDSKLAKEFRGTTFDNETKQCICRPLPKFFNVGEKDETQHHLVDWDNAVFYTKHDGSMLTPVLINNKVFWKTKNTFYSDVAIAAQKFYDANPFELHDITTYTPIYEYVGPGNQIVLPYEKEELIYLGYRDINTGEYFPSSEHYVPDMTYEQVVDLEEVEGFVIWDGNQLVKAKTNWYLERHKICSDFNIKAIINASLDNTVDDMLATIAQLGLTLRYYQVAQLRDKVIRERFIIEHDVETFFELVTEHNTGSRKDVAIYITTGFIPKEYRGIMFSMLDGKDVQEAINKLTFEAVYAEYKNVEEDEDENG